MKDQDFQKFLDRIIFKKRWDEIKDNWLPYITAIDPPGTAIKDDLSEIIDLTRISDSLNEDDREEYKIEEAEYVRPFILREAIFSLHKAANIISTSQNSALKGYPTWSIVDAYHGSFITARSILSFFGLSSPNIKTSKGESNLIIIDCWPSLIQPKEKRKQLKLGSNNSVLFSKSKLPKFDQRHIWMILQRYLNVITINESTWAKDYLKIINGIDFRNFGKQRNYVFYSNNSWLFEDLHSFIVDENFGLFNDTFIKKFRDKEKNLVSDFSLCIALLMLKMSSLLFTELCSTSRLLEKEYKILNDCLTSEEKHPLLINSFK